jgi:hypothetical protein
MNNQIPPQPKGLWDRKTYLSMAVTTLLTTVLALGVCAFKGETVASDQSTPASLLQAHTEGV